LASGARQRAYRLGVNVPGEFALEGGSVERVDHIDIVRRIIGHPDRLAAIGTANAKALIHHGELAGFADHALPGKLSEERSGAGELPERSLILAAIGAARHIEVGMELRAGILMDKGIFIPLPCNPPLQARLPRRARRTTPGLAPRLNQAIAPFNLWIVFGTARPNPLHLDPQPCQPQR